MTNRQTPTVGTVESEGEQTYRPAPSIADRKPNRPHISPNRVPTERYQLGE